MKRKQEYKIIYLPDTGEQVYEHIHIAEKALGKPLPKGVQVHHVDFDKTNNSNGNLVICPDQAYHRLLHRRTKALEACGNPNYYCCRFCGEWDDPNNMGVDGPRGYAHRECRSADRRIQYRLAKVFQ